MLSRICNTRGTTTTRTKIRQWEVIRSGNEECVGLKVKNESMSLWVNLVMAYGSVRDNAENQEMKNIQ